MKPVEEIINNLAADALSDLTRHLLGFVSDGRVARIDRVLDRRTRYLTVVMENIYRPHNASAVLRSCECFGIQDVHAIESMNRFEVNSAIVQGAAKWLSLYRHRGTDATRSCLQGLKNSGYRIVAMSLDGDSLPVEQLQVHEPLALCFGSEEPGLSAEAMAMTDLSARIPMHGFTQSLNLSVSAGIALERLAERLHSSGCNWQLTPSERDVLRCLWLARSISAGSDIVHRHLSGAA